MLQIIFVIIFKDHEAKKKISTITSVTTLISFIIIINYFFIMFPILTAIDLLNPMPFSLLHFFSFSFFTHRNVQFHRFRFRSCLYHLPIAFLFQLGANTDHPVLFTVNQNRLSQAAPPLKFGTLSKFFFSSTH